MNNFDVVYLASTLVGPMGLERSVKEHLICELIRVAVDVYNFPATENTEVGNLLVVMENDYGVMGGEQLFQKFLSQIRSDAKQAGWDPRLVIKVNFKLIGKGFHQAHIAMDLDATFTNMYNEGIPKQDNDVDVTTLVSDNPGLDAINELTHVHNTETARRIPVLSDRLATVVQTDSSGGWWDRYQTR